MAGRMSTPLLNLERVRLFAIRDAELCQSHGKPDQTMHYSEKRKRNVSRKLA